MSEKFQNSLILVGIVSIAFHLLSTLRYRGSNLFIRPSGRLRPTRAWSGLPCGSLMDRTPFCFCPRWHAKFPYTDQHLACNLCLSPDLREDNCEACKSFRSKKTLRDRRAQRLEMASKSTERLDVEEEEIMQMAVSVRGSDSEQESEEDRPFTAGQHVSTPAPVPAKPKHKALGIPLPEGHGSIRKKTFGDQPTTSTPKKATPPKPSDSRRCSLSEPIKHRSFESKP
ncbi:hypothetical protein NDU88_003089 [Pleurodeles waltl]|uniref:Uncharacterized protein n=1 Tax=Pleurodeles waltl TaxID=8319 RepID=A0AAV7MRH1_PLEWA|nr:hypothetical protein NDU88_003089 [Pleurodeles waltl]